MNRKEEHDPFDSWLVDQLADRQPSFKEEYWIAAQQLIEADEAGRKSKKRFWMFWLSYGLQGLALSSLLLYWGSQELLSFDKEQLSPLAITRVENSSEANGFSNSLSLPESSSPTRILSEETDALITQYQASTQQVNPKNALPQPHRNSLPLSTISTEEEGGVTPLVSLTTVQEDNLLPSLLSQEAEVSMESEQLAILPAIDSILRVWEPLWEINQPQGPLGEITQQDFQPYLTLGIRAGWQAGGTLTPLSFGIEGAGPLAGIRAKYRISPGTEIFAGANYLSTESFNPQVDIQSRQLKFGLNQEVTRYELERLQLLDIPLGIRKYMGRHSVQLSLHSLIPIQANHQLSLVRQNAFNEFSSRDLGRVKGIRQGIRDVSLGVGLGYDYQLTQHLLMGIEAQLYPQGLFLEAPYSLTNQRPFFLGVGIEYDLVKIK